MIIVSSGAGAIVALSVDRIIPGLLGFVLAIILSMIVVGWILWIADRRLTLGLGEGLTKAFPQVAFLLGYSRSDLKAR